MLNKKFIISAVLSILLITGNSVSAGSNDLLRMDLKKSAADDTVDVTFYTTGSSQNTVVTRKSGNSYVVLLPNVAGNQSVVPSLGGVKDLVSNVAVKNVDDGIGGYTKVTFSTTKPVKFQTYTKKTAPLTKAQQDYKTLIAQNSKFDPDKKMESFKKTNKPVNTSKSVQKETPKTASGAAASSKAIKSDVSKNIQNNIKNKSVSKPAAPVIKHETAKTSVKVNPSKILRKVQPAPKQQNTEVKPQTRAITPVVPKVEPKQETKIVQPVQKANTSVSKTPDNIKKSKQSVQVKANNAKTNEPQKELPVIPIAGAISVIGLFALGMVFNAISRTSGKNSNKIKDYSKTENSAQKSNNKEYYKKIADDKKLNWQEKYKLYSEKQQDETNEKANDNMSYVAGMKNSKGTIVSDDIKKKVSQMEHALSQTPNITPPENIKKDVQSEENSIVNSMSNIKLKSFAKHINLRETNRNFAYNNKTNTEEKLKEGPLVKLKPSALSMSRREISSSSFNISDLVRRGRIYLHQNSNSVSIPQKEERYTLSSLNDYLKILDEEETNSQNFNTEEQISSLMPQRSRNMKSVTNPLMKKGFKTSSSDINGINVKSKYDIDDDKSIFTVNVNGISALIGKIGENIFVLKKFDKIINKPLQVRLDYGNVYIVKMGSFKCLVDVTDNKMGTLLEI